MKKILPFMIGALCAIPMEIIGRVFVGEFAFLVMAPIIFIKKLSRPQARFLVSVLAVLVISLSGYVISDLYRGTPRNDYLRGWADYVFLAIDFAGMFALSLQQRGRVEAFSLGYAVTLIADMNQYGGYGLDNWKLGWAVPVTVIVLVASGRLSLTCRGVVCLMLGIANFYLDYRSLGLMLFILVARIALVKMRRRSARFALRNVLLASLIGIVLTSMLTFVYLKSQESDSDFATRRDASNAGRIVAIEMAVHKISESPLVGWGSWATSPELDSEFAYLTNRMSDNAITLEGLSESGFRPHSQIIQSWYEGGILGVALFSFLLLRSLRAAYFLLWQGNEAVDELLRQFWVINSIWSVLASPFAGQSRLFIALGLVAIYSIDATKKASVILK